MASLRPRPGSTVGYATRIALRELGRRAEFLGGQIERLDELIVPLVDRPGPWPARRLRRRPGHRRAAADRRRGPSGAAALGGRLGAPVRRSRRSPPRRGRSPADRLNPGGNREANHALWRIVITRMGSHPATRAYADRRTAEGLSKKEIIRCLKRYVAREVYRHLRPAA